MSDNLTAGCDFDFHGHALDNIFDTYKELRNRCPVGRSEEHGGFWFLMKSEDIFAAEQSPDTFSVTPSMLLPPIVLLRVSEAAVTLKAFEPLRVTVPAM